MEIETKVLSRVIIKPSSPTPKSLQKHHLSFLDQISGQAYVSFVYFYPSNPRIPNSEKSKQLKKSLSDLLSTFYPLAGRLIGNLYVDCNDAGAPFFDAEADRDISQAISDPNPKEMEKHFLPYKTGKPLDFLMAVQATHFRCGGLAVGVMISHKVFDASSFSSFVNTWSAVVRDGVTSSGGPPPKFDAAAYFPPLDILGSHSQLDRGGMVVEEDVITPGKVFRFSAATISALRDMYASGGRRAGRVEALSAFIWTRFMSAAGLTSDPDKISTVRIVVNLRTRADPPLSGDHFGNIVASAVVRPAAGDGGVEYVRKVREAVEGVDGGHVARMKNSEKYYLEEMMARANVEELGCLTFSSLCRFPFYEADFGWGRPVRVGLGLVFEKNAVLLMDAAEIGGDINAFVYLNKQHMELFENHLKFHALKSNL